MLLHAVEQTAGVRRDPAPRVWQKALSDFFVEYSARASSSRGQTKRVRHINGRYAQRIISTPGKRVGLAWKNEDGSWGGPVGEGIAKALQQGYSSRTEPYHGYYFKILKGQGPAAPLGRMDFMVNGVMIGGFALVAVPAQYRVTGVKTFIVSYEDIVYENDLGPDSLNIVKKMELYNPGKTWRRTDDSW